MQISRIDDIHHFDKLKTAWDAVYSTDPHAHIFVSWAWLRGYFEVTRYNWFVLAIRPDNISPYIAFFPLRLHVGLKHYFCPVLELNIGGSPIADYTGFVCSPEYEEKAVENFAYYVQRHLEWDRFQMRDVLDPRLELFLKYFSLKKFNVCEVDRMSCPYIQLPNKWDKYLQDFPSRNTRRNLQSSFRGVENLNEFHVTHVQEDNLKGQIETLLMLWQLRWGAMSKNCLNAHRHIFHSCFENKCLWLTVLWNGETPIAALAAFADRQKNTFSSYINGFNNEFAKLSPGKVIVGYSIKYAIENGFEIYDFLRGSEDYKFDFGAVERFNTSILVTRKGLPRTLLKFFRGLPRLTKENVLSHNKSQNTTSNF